MKIRWTKEAYAEVLKQYRDGARKCDIARSLGLSPVRARQIIALAERNERRTISALDKLSTRSRNALMGFGLTSVEAVRDAVIDGRIDDVPNLGLVSVVEVKMWLAEHQK